MMELVLVLVLVCGANNTFNGNHCKKSFMKLCSVKMSAKKCAKKIFTQWNNSGLEVVDE